MLSSEKSLNRFSWWCNINVFIECVYCSSTVLWENVFYHTVVTNKKTNTNTNTKTKRNTRRGNRFSSITLRLLSSPPYAFSVYDIHNSLDVTTKRKTETKRSKDPKKLSWVLWVALGCVSCIELNEVLIFVLKLHFVSQNGDSWVPGRYKACNPKRSREVP